METSQRTRITASTTVDADVQTVWTCWTEPEHITRWNNASDDWHSPRATNDLRIGGRFNTRMEAKDGSAGFDFEGVYTAVKPYDHIAYEMSDGRKVTVEFHGHGHHTHVTETFDAEETNPVEMQRGGWQAILENFRKYVEAL
jgi:uncharacterized protein YndB with AHSA1/START domain